MNLWLLFKEGRYPYSRFSLFSSECILFSEKCNFDKDAHLNLLKLHWQWLGLRTLHIAPVWAGWLASRLTFLSVFYYFLICFVLFLAYYSFSFITLMFFVPLAVKSSDLCYISSHESVNLGR